MKKLLTLVLVLLVVSVFGAGTVLADTETFGGDTTGKPVFYAPDEDCEGLFYSSEEVNYETHRFSVSVSGTYTLDLEAFDTNEFDPYLAVYESSFSADEPEDNCIAANDDTFGLNARVVVSLDAGTTYIAVAAGYEDDDEGPYTLTISGPGDIIAGGGGSGGIAGNLLDGRLNNNPAQDVAAPVAVYAEAGSFKVYAINPADGVGVFVLLVEGAAVEAGQTNSALLGQTINPFTNAVISVYLLPSGEYQLITTAADGKAYSTVFSAPAPAA